MAEKDHKRVVLFFPLLGVDPSPPVDQGQASTIEIHLKTCMICWEDF